MAAPEAKKQKLDSAAAEARPDHLVALVDARRGRAGGARGVVAAQHLAGAPIGLHRLHAAGAVDQRQLVGVDVEARQHGGGVAGVGHRRGQQLALGAHRHELARAHRQRARQQPGQAGEQHGRGGGAAADDAEHQREVAHEAVVGPEHGRAERARDPGPAAGREPAHHLLVDALVGGHGRAWRRRRRRRASGSRRAGRARARTPSRTGGRGRPAPASGWPRGRRHPGRRRAAAPSGPRAAPRRRRAPGGSRAPHRSGAPRDRGRPGLRPARRRASAATCAGWPEMAHPSCRGLSRPPQECRVAA